MIIYKAKVVSTEDQTNTKNNICAVKVYVAKVLGTGEFTSDDIKEVVMLSQIPTSPNGASSISTPHTGDLCLVYDNEDGLPLSIVGYFPAVGLSNYGIWNSEAVPIGGYSLRVGGQYPVSMTISPAGSFSVFNSAKSHFGLNAALSTFTLQSDNVHIKSRSGYVTSQIVVRGTKEYIANTSVFGQSYDDPSCTDVSEQFVEVEEYHPNNLIATSYCDKVVIRSGLITSAKQSFNISPIIKSHVYEMDTRQSVINKTKKDTVTCLQVGKLNLLSSIDGNLFGSLVDWTTKEAVGPLFNTSRLSMGGPSFVLQSNVGVKGLTPSGPTDLLVAKKGYDQEFNSLYTQQFNIKTTALGGYQSWYHTAGVGFKILSNILDNKSGAYYEEVGKIDTRSVVRKIDSACLTYNVTSDIDTNVIKLGKFFELNVGIDSAVIKFGATEIKLTTTGVAITSTNLTWNNLKLITDAAIMPLVNHTHFISTSPGLTLLSTGLTPLSTFKTGAV